MSPPVSPGPAGTECTQATKPGSSISLAVLSLPAQLSAQPMCVEVAGTAPGLPSASTRAATVMPHP